MGFDEEFDEIFKELINDNISENEFYIGETGVFNDNDKTRVSRGELLWSKSMMVQNIFKRECDHKDILKYI